MCVYIRDGHLSGPFMVWVTIFCLLLSWVGSKLMISFSLKLFINYSKEYWNSVQCKTQIRHFNRSVMSWVTGSDFSVFLLRPRCPDSGLGRVGSSELDQLSLVYIYVTLISTRILHLLLYNFSLTSGVIYVLQCFDTVGWAAGKASGL